MLKQLDRLLTGTQQQHHPLTVGIETGLLADQIRAGKGKTTGFREQNRQGTLVTTHALKIKSLTNRTLRFVDPKPFDKRGPEVIHRRQSREIKL